MEGPLIARLASPAARKRIREELGISEEKKILLLGFGGHDTKWTLQDSFIPTEVNIHILCKYTYIYIRTYIHTYLPTSIQLYFHRRYSIDSIAYVQTTDNTYIHLFILYILSSTCMYAFLHTYKPYFKKYCLTNQALIHTVYVHINIHTYITCKHTHFQTYIHTYIHTHDSNSTQ